MKYISSQRADTSAKKTVSPVEAGAVATNFPPEFVEVAVASRIWGIRRTSMYGLLKTGEIKSVLLRRPGCLTGKRLIVAASVRDYLLRELKKQGGYKPGVCNALRNTTETEKPEAYGQS